MRVVLGVGLSSGAEPAQLQELVRAVLAGRGLHADDVAAVVTLDRKAEVAAIQELARTLGAEVVAYPSDVLAVHQVPHPSSVVARAVDTPSVAEAAVLAYGARLLIAKTALGRCTVAAGGLAGPGAPEYRRSSERCILPGL